MFIKLDPYESNFKNRQCLSQINSTQSLVQAEVKRIALENFLDLSTDIAVLDVRTKEEYLIGHIPGATNLELFDTEQRGVIGKIYKKQGKGDAVKAGLEFVSPKISALLSEVESKIKGDSIAIHCWRGGMRSESLAWLISFALNINTFVLDGGYKAYRQSVLDKFTTEYEFLVLGGYTGSAKTEILSCLNNRGHQVLDLERLANHRGSAFGSIGLNDQPVQQIFENRVAKKLEELNSKLPIWVEDESRRIGHRIIPHDLFNSIKASKHYFIDIPFQSRVKHLLESYGQLPVEDLVASSAKLENRLGLEKTSYCINLLQKGKIEEACEILLKYYDKSYAYGLSKNKPELVTKVVFESIDMEEIANELERQIALK